MKKNRSFKQASECKILIVDDDKKICNMLVDVLHNKYEVEPCYRTKEAFQKISIHQFDIVITDLKLNDGSGIDILKMAKTKDPFTEVIIITGYGSFETAFDAINLGVTSYLNKPLKIEEFTLQVEKAVASRIFHLKSMHLITQTDYNNIPNVQEHILDITSLNFITSKLVMSLDIPEVMQIILGDINEKLDSVYSIIGIQYLKFNEIFAMPKNGTLNKTTLIKIMLQQWQDAFSIFKKNEIEQTSIPITIFEGKLKKILLNSESYKNCVSLPLTILGETIGFIALFYTKEKPFRHSRFQFFSVYTSLITSAIQHCYIDLLSKQQAKTDSLTGVANHRMFHEILERELSRSKRKNRQFCLAMIDIDDFKKVNDTYGHLVGDAVLIDLTIRTSHTMRGGDLLARYGGEEFAIILFDTDLKGAEILAQRVCKAIADTPFFYHKSKIYYTVSIGLVACNSQTKPNKDYIIGQADQALYLAKRNGKNRVELVNIDHNYKLKLP